MEGVKTTRIIVDKANDRRRYRWVVEIIVDETWVEDGLNFSDEDRVQNMVQAHIGWSYSHETDCRVLAAPPSEAIRKAQGFVTAK